MYSERFTTNEESDYKQFEFEVTVADQVGASSTDWTLFITSMMNIGEFLLLMCMISYLLYQGALIQTLIGGVTFKLIQDKLADISKSE